MNFKSVLFFVCIFCCTNLCCVIKGTAWSPDFTFSESEKAVKNFYEGDDWEVFEDNELEEKGRNELKDVDVKDVRWFELLTNYEIGAIKIEKSDSYATSPFVLILPLKIRPLLRAISGVDSKNNFKVVYIFHELYTSRLLRKLNGTHAYRDCLIVELIQLVDQKRSFNFRTKWDKEIEEAEKKEAEKIQKELEKEVEKKEKEKQKEVMEKQKEVREKQKQVEEKEKEIKEKEKELEEKEREKQKELRQKEMEKKLIVSQKDSEIRIAKNSLENEKELSKFRKEIAKETIEILKGARYRSNGISASEIPSYKPSKNFC